MRTCDRSGRLHPKKFLMWSDIVYSRGWAFIHEVYGHVCRFCPVPFRRVLLVHHGLCNLYYVPVFALGYAVLLRCVTTGEFSSDFFLAEISREHIREIFFASI